MAALAASSSLFAPTTGEKTAQDDIVSRAVLYEAQVETCPIACEYAGPDPAAWTTYHSFDELALCNDTVLFTFDVFSAISTPRIKTCLTTTKGPQMQAGAFYGLINNNVTNFPSPEIVTEMLQSEGVITSLDDSCGGSLQNSSISIQRR